MSLSDRIICILFIVVLAVFCLIAIPLQLLPLPILIVLLVLSFLLFLAQCFGSLILQKKQWHYIRRSFMLCLMSLYVIACFVFLGVDRTISQMSDFQKNGEHVKLITLKENSDTLDDYKNEPLGIYPSDYVTQQLFIDYLKNRWGSTVKTLSYESKQAAYEALENREIKAILLSQQAYAALDDDYHINKHVRLVYEHTLTLQPSEQISVLSTPFHVLISGIDVVGSAEQLTRSDVNMLVSVNLQTKQVLLTSIPRDAYIDNTCMDNRKDKLTHTALKGQKCSVQSVEKLLGIEIPFYVKLSFSSIIDVVDAIGGLDVNVPMDFCEYDETKQRVLHIQKGQRMLNGKETLALARHRYTLYDGDVGRTQNQQLIINALIHKTKSLALLTKIESILDIAARTVQTNLTQSQIYSLIRYQVEDQRPYLMQNQTLNGYSDLRVTASLPNTALSVVVLSKDSTKQAVAQIKSVMQGVNLNDFSYRVTMKAPTKSVKETSGAKGNGRCHIR